MLVRDWSDGAALCIGQASHAWLSGQLARAWAWEPVPAEEVCLAAMQHDIGMAEWDLAPALDPDSGRPVNFMSMALDEHIALWTAAPTKLFTQSRYAALLVSMHGTALYARRDLTRLPLPAAEAVRGYLAGQRALQARLASELGLTEPELRRDQARVFCWDAMSLALCLGWPPYSTPEVDGRSVRMEPAGDGAFTLDPWPLRGDSLEVRCEGRVLTGTATTAAALHDALERAERVDLRYRLLPAT